MTLTERIGRVGVWGASVFLAMLSQGCFYHEDWAGHRVPLSMAPAGHRATTSTTSAPAPAVAVSLVYSTPWVWLPTHMERDPLPPYNQVCIERIEFLDPDRATLYVPQTGGWVMWPFLFIKSEESGVGLFRPGYELAFQGAAPDNAPAGLEWDPAPLFGRALYTGRSLDATSTRRPATMTAPPRDAYPRLMADHPFWRALRERYESGANREAIKVICQATLRAAQRRLLTHPNDTPTAEEILTVEWCRSVAVQVP
jgi:hypothetical protein